MSLILTKDDETLQSEFFHLATPQDVASLLDVEFYKLKYHLYILDYSLRYFSFPVPKKSGGERRILAPSPSLKIIQSKLLQVLETVYKPKKTVHGFVKDFSIVTNAERHAGQRNVLNIDLLDFFGTIHFGRVRGLFMAPPYELSGKVSTVLAQICCYDNQLPQGAPTSPIVSNMICVKMDAQLRQLAIKNRCFYTRYADDLTFSTSIRNFPGGLATIVPSGEVELGDDLLEVINSNDFQVNSSKIRLQTQYRRQEVTGLTVNEFPNVKREFILQVRAMLHDWNINGYESAAKKHYHIHGSKQIPPFKEPPSYKNIVKGKIDFIGMVRGKEDPVYRKYLYEYADLNPEFLIPELIPSQVHAKLHYVNVFTEGKTDRNHLLAARNHFDKQGVFVNLVLRLTEDDENFGGDKLLKHCISYSKNPTDHPEPVIFLFDNDDLQILKRAQIETAQVHAWGKNVYSSKLPIPSHRKENPNICIELLYEDDEITRKDSVGHRLFISSEFNPISGRHLKEDLNYTNQKRLENSPHIFIIDDGVIDDNSNVALPKSKFAEYILRNEKNFDDFDFSAFIPIFELFEELSN